MIKLSDHIKGKTARFVQYREGNFIYQVDTFQFPVPLEDIAGATLLAEDKAIFFTKWIVRHLKMVTILPNNEVVFEPK